MIDLVSEFGTHILPDNLKTVPILHVLYSERDKIHAGNEYRTRINNAPLTGDHLRNLILKLTGDYEQADIAKAKFDLADSKKERQ